MSIAFNVNPYGLILTWQLQQDGLAFALLCRALSVHRALRSKQYSWFINFLLRVPFAAHGLHQKLFAFGVPCLPSSLCRH